MSVEMKYLNTDLFPTHWCAGCGHGIVTRAVARVFENMKLNKDDIVAVSGIGCSARTPAWFDVNSVQTIHGRAIAFATGIKSHLPDKHVILFLGDGDCAAIGGNHLIHAAKRNIDLTVVVMNNHIYGMTGGQMSPTTPTGSKTSTSVYGNIDRQLDVCAIAAAAGATFVARTTAYHVNQIPSLVQKGMEHKGFSLIEIVDPCVTGYGHRNNFKNAGEIYDWLKDAAIPVTKAKDLSSAELEGKIVTGILKHEQGVKEYTETYDSFAKELTDKKNVYNQLRGIDVCEVVDQEAIERVEFRLSGSGGQGLVLAGIILSEAIIRQSKNAVHTQSYGPEARGGASRSEVVVSDGRIDYPVVSNPDVLLAMTQDAFDKFKVEMRPGGIVLCDTTFVKTTSLEGVKIFECPITEIAIKEIGDVRCANVIGLGILAGLLRYIDKESLAKAIANRVSATAREINLRALDKGYEIGLQMKSKSEN